MNCPIENIDEERGSVTLEAAILMTILTGVILFFVSIMQIIAAKNVLEISVIRTGNTMCKWAPIYKYTIADNIESVIDENLGEKLLGQLTDEAEEIVVNIINLSNIKQNSMDYAYGYVAQTLTQRYIEESPLVHSGFIKMNDLNMYKSEFFYNDSNDIEIKGVCEVETFLPITVKVSYGVNCRAWGKGTYPHNSIDDKEETDTDSVWKRDNYSRGKILREIYGGNLPENFPIISSYENGVVTMIKSLNHKMPSYSDGGMLTRTVKQMIDSLAGFNGKSWGGINVQKKDIKFRKLILVMPEDDFSSVQEMSLQEIRSYATRKGVLFDLQRYQKV